MAAKRGGRKTGGEDAKKSAGENPIDASLVPRWLAEGDLIIDPKNANEHDERGLAAIMQSMRRYGQRSPIVIQRGTMIVKKGNGTLMAFRRLCDEFAGSDRPEIFNETIRESLRRRAIACVDAPLDDIEARAYAVADNQIGRLSRFNEIALGETMHDLSAGGYDLKLLGFEDAEIQSLLAGPATPDAPADPAAARATLAERFGFVPFSVLDARAGIWQDRKRAWLALGIKSEIGRAGNLLEFSDAVLAGGYGVSKKEKTKDAFNKNIDPRGKARSAADGGVSGNHRERDAAFVGNTGASIFDPVLCELSYRWFAPPGGMIVDPFAGGSVRGIVAAKLGRHYFGTDLRDEQIAANREQADDLLAPDDPPPQWRAGDSRDLMGEAPEADFIFSCPPYADLERYSDDPRDLSTMEYEKFIEAFRMIVAGACARLRDDRFAAFVVGDVRDKRGNYRNFVGDCVSAFRGAGLALYNDAILVTAVGSLPIRVGRQFEAMRKLGKTHQNVLVFLKGDARKATENVGACDFALSLEAAAVDEGGGGGADAGGISDAGGLGGRADDVESLAVDAPGG